jgi:hypothetical protein
MHVAVLDVPAVFAQVQRDVVGTGLLGHQRGVHGIWIRRAAGLADRRHVIDVDAEFYGAGHAAPRRDIERATARVRNSRPSRQ